MSHDAWVFTGLFAAQGIAWFTIGFVVGRWFL
jgi:hypothetical protein